MIESTSLSAELYFSLGVIAFMLVVFVGFFVWVIKKTKEGGN